MMCSILLVTSLTSAGAFSIPGLRASSARTPAISMSTYAEYLARQQGGVAPAPAVEAPVADAGPTYADYFAQRQGVVAPAPAAEYVAIPEYATPPPEEFVPMSAVAAQEPVADAGPTYAEYLARQQGGVAPAPAVEAPVADAGPTYADYFAQRQGGVAPAPVAPPAPEYVAPPVEEFNVPPSAESPAGPTYDPWSDDDKTLVQIYGKMYRVRM